MSKYPPPAGAPPGFDGEGEGYPTHNPYAATGGYAFAPGQHSMQAPPPGGHFGGGGAPSLAERARMLLSTRARAGDRYESPNHLRSVIIFTSTLSALYLLGFCAYSSFRQLTSGSEAGKLKIYDAVEGALYSVAGAIEVFGVFAAVRLAYALARLYSFASCISLGATLAAELLGIIVHFAHRDLVVDSCTARNTNTTYLSFSAGWSWSGGDSDWDDRNAAFNATTARSWCETVYKRQGPWMIVFFLASAFFGALLVALSFAFVRRLDQPGAGRRTAKSRARGAHAPSAQYAGMMGGAGAGGNRPELRYDAYPMAGGPGGGRRSTDSDYAWDARADPYNEFESGGYGDADEKRRGADGDASTLVGDGEAERKAKFGGVGDEDDDDDEARRGGHGSNSRPGSSRGVRAADNPV